MVNMIVILYTFLTLDHGENIGRRVKKIVLLSLNPATNIIHGKNGFAECHFRD
jgi:hypothetical protein